MNNNDQIKCIKRIAREDGRFSPEAFFLVADVIHNTSQWIKEGSLRTEDGYLREEDNGQFHVSGRELMVGLRRLAKERWGCMARHVLEEWGLRRSEDVGEVVFLMVEDSDLGWRKRECDTREDFSDGFDFAETFDVL